MSYKISGIGVVNNVFFTSDTLFGSEVAMDKLDRPFSNIHDMDETLIKNWNSVIKHKDIVYHAGNFSTHDKKDIETILKRLNGRINLIVGEYDNNSNILAFRHKLASVNYRLDFKINQWQITLAHYPQRFWYNMRYGSWHLHGYTCGTVPPIPLTMSFDVGTDISGYTPIHFEELENIMVDKYNYYNIEKERIQGDLL